MPEHTPGPWVVREQGEANEFAILSADGKWVLGLRHNGEPLQEQQRTNMRLIAAAPGMIEALELCRSNIKTLNAVREMEGVIQWDAWLEVVEQTIAKAKGGNRE